MKIKKIYIALLLTFSFVSPSMAKQEIKLQCVGDYTFSNKVKYDEIVELIIYRDSDNDNNVKSVVLDIYFVTHDYNGGSIRETEKNIIATNTTDAGFAEKILIKYSLKDSSILMVANFENGSVNKFEGTCY